jgi:hypothetical protein
MPHRCSQAAFRQDTELTVEEGVNGASGGEPHGETFPSYADGYHCRPRSSVVSSSSLEVVCRRPGRTIGWGAEPTYVDGVSMPTVYTEGHRWHRSTPTSITVGTGSFSCSASSFPTRHRAYQAGLYNTVRRTSQTNTLTYRSYKSCNANETFTSDDGVLAHVANVVVGDMPQVS